jgi:hypothetical protein
MCDITHAAMNVIHHRPVFRTARGLWHLLAVQILLMLALIAAHAVTNPALSVMAMIPLSPNVQMRPLRNL